MNHARMLSLVSVLVVAVTTGCEAQQHATVDTLVCEDALRPSTAQALQEAFTHPDLDNLAAIVSPQDLARVVALVPQAEAVVVVGRNVWSVVDSGFGKDVIAHGWDGVQCGEPVTLQCTAGAGVSIVDCDDGGAFQITQQLDGCTLHGVTVDGVVVLGKDGDAVGVDVDVVVDEVSGIAGEFVVDGHGLRSTGPVRFDDHAGYSCASSMGFDDMAVQADGETTRLSFVGSVDDDGPGVVVDSKGIYDGASACPLPGAALMVGVGDVTATIAFDKAVSVDVDGHDVPALAAAVQAMCGDD